MKPTQEQIEAALAYVDGTASHDDKETLLLSSDELRSYAMAALFIIAAAYREAMAEIERLQGKLSASNFVAAIPPHEIICRRCGLREERGEKPSCDF
jgi:hypothetical protein